MKADLSPEALAELLEHVAATAHRRAIALAIDEGHWLGTDCPAQICKQARATARALREVKPERYLCPRHRDLGYCIGMGCVDTFPVYALGEVEVADEL